MVSVNNDSVEEKQCTTLATFLFAVTKGKAKKAYNGSCSSKVLNMWRWGKGKAAAIPESSKLITVSRRQRTHHGWQVAWETIKTTSVVHHFQQRPFLNSAQTVPPTAGQVPKQMSLWDHSHSNYHRWLPDLHRLMFITPFNMHFFPTWADPVIFHSIHIALNSNILSPS